MIANCPSCGTHFKHEATVVPVRARCGRCDSILDLTRFRQYRIVRAKAPALAAAAAAASSGSHHIDLWSEQDPLPEIPEMKHREAFEARMPCDADGAMLESDRAGEISRRPTGWRRDAGGATTFLLWVAAGAIAGTGASWTAGGTTIPGLVVGAVLGILTGWGWMKWTSPR